MQVKIIMVVKMRCDPQISHFVADVFTIAFDKFDSISLMFFSIVLIGCDSCMNAFLR
ncbi:hypothetical protein HACA111877_15245 [Halomonas casei]